MVANERMWLVQICSKATFHKRRGDNITIKFIGDMVYIVECEIEGLYQFLYFTQEDKDKYSIKEIKCVDGLPVIIMK
jgi:hypothetical protein